MVSLAVAGRFYAFLIASRAVWIDIYRAIISSALSILRSSSYGATVMVTDYARFGCLSDGSESY
jgi:hypothetical protein